MSIKYTGLACLLSAILAAIVTQHYFPTIQTKIVDNTKEVTKVDVQTVIKTTTQPNGQTESTTTITDHSQKIDIEHKSVIVSEPKNWLASGIYTVDIHDAHPIYGADIKYRLFDSLFIGGMVDTTGQPRVTLGWAF